MAQPIFDHHPLEAYLHDAGETPYPMPGGDPAFTPEPPVHQGHPWLLRALVHVPPAVWDLLELAHASLATTGLVPPPAAQHHAHAFAERFKYALISSSLLETALSFTGTGTGTGTARPGSQTASPEPSHHRPLPPLFIPSHPNPAHSRNASTKLDIPGSLALPPTLGSHWRHHPLLHLHQPHVHTHPLDPRAASLAFLSAVCALQAFFVLAVVLFSAAVFFACTIDFDDDVVEKTEEGDAATLTLDTLGALVEAGQLWDSRVSEALSNIEQEERTSALLHYSPSPPSSPISALRTALHASLQTTQTQCDNVRQLLAALTSPTALPQLSEMYAPASPFLRAKASRDLRGEREGTEQSESLRPLSLPTRTGAARQRVTSSPTPADKRSTWSGANFATVGAGRMTLAASRSLKRRSELPAFLLPPAPRVLSRSVPSTPSGTSASPSGGLAEVEIEVEEEEQDSGEEGSLLSGDFGSAALELRRIRRQSGMDALGLVGIPASTPAPPPNISPRSPSPVHSSLSSRSAFSPPPSRSSVFGQQMHTASSPSRFTALSPSRHAQHGSSHGHRGSLAHAHSHSHLPSPLSFASLQLALQAALGAKRYACAHLLALRFQDPETATTHPFSPTPSTVPSRAPTPDSPRHSHSRAHSRAYARQVDDEPEADDAYWEDVRSVMALLASTLEDAAARVGEALAEIARVRVEEGTPSVPSESRRVSMDSDALRAYKAGLFAAGHDGMPSPASRRVSLLGLGMPSALGWGSGGAARAASSSFAPMPSHLSRFAAHAEAIATSLVDARDHLDATLAALRNPHANENETENERASPQETDAYQAFDRLRRELGLALRECERGRSVLLDALTPAPPIDDDERRDSLDADAVPALGHDVGSSGDSDKQDIEGQDTPEDGSPLLGSTRRATLAFPPPNSALEQQRQQQQKEDDATQHLLMGASARDLPPPGIEQVFESEAVPVGGFARERSKLTREERIRLAQAKRAVDADGSVVSGVGVGAGSGGDGERRESWGPGGEVVQELKDVIWKVGERRRKMTETAAVAAATEGERTKSQSVTPTPSTHLLVADDAEFLDAEEGHSRAPSPLPQNAEPIPAVEPAASPTPSPISASSSALSSPGPLFPPGIPQPQPLQNYVLESS